MQKHQAKICHITTAHPPFDVRIFHKECKALLNHFAEVALIAQHDKNENVDGVQIIALPKAKNRRHRMLKLPLKAYRMAMNFNADIYHFHDPELMPVMQILKIFSGKIIIYDVHEDYSKQALSKEYIPEKMRKVISNLTKKLEKIFSKRFDGIVTATDFILENFYYHKNVISIKNYPIVTNEFENDKACRIKKSFNIVYAGAISEIRGLSQTVKALEYVHGGNEVRLTLCGEFELEEYADSLKHLKGYQYVDYIGLIKPNQVKEILHNSDVGIVCYLPEPNHIRSMPTKLFEYMAAGLPVIASNFPIWKEIVEGNNCGICVNPTDPKDIARAINWFVENPDKASNMGGEHAYRIVKEKYNWQQEQRKLVSFYKDVIR